VLLVIGQTTLALATAIANALSHALVQVLKRTVARPRPCDADGRPLALVELPDPFSFPSGHAAAATALAASITLYHPLMGPVVLPLAAVVAWSRVALRVHYLSDVIAGTLLGFLGALAAIALL
jgi:undecaprenyl-diphosphatase